MTKRTLDHLGMPRSTAQYALQALGSARRRWLQMLPGHGPVPAPGEEGVSHYVGPEDEAVLGPAPDNPLPDGRETDVYPQQEIALRKEI